MSARIPRSEPRPWYVKWGITFVVGLLVVFAMATSRDLFDQTDPAKVWEILCDGCFLAAVLLVCVGLMTFISSEGMFDIVGYSMIAFLDIFRKKDKKPVQAAPLPCANAEGESKLKKGYFEYKQSKAGTRHSQWYLVFVGLIYLAAAFVCLLGFEMSGAA